MLRGVEAGGGVEGVVQRHAHEGGELVLSRDLLALHHVAALDERTLHRVVVGAVLHDRLREVAGAA